MAFNRVFFNRRFFGVNPGSTSGGGGVVYLLQEDFSTGSGSTPPTGWSAQTGGTWNFSNTSPALPHGGNNVSILSGAADLTWKAFTGQTECWAYFQFQIASLAIGGLRTIFALQDSGGTNQCFARLNTDGTFQIWDGNAEGIATSGAISANTNYQVWIHYKAGSGAGVIDLGFSTNGTRPTSGANFAQLTNTTTNATVSRVALIANDNIVSQYMDWILVNNSQIGDNP